MWEERNEVVNITVLSESTILHHQKLIHCIHFGFPAKIKPLCQRTHNQPALYQHVKFGRNESISKWLDWITYFLCSIHHRRITASTKSTCSLSALCTTLLWLSWNTLCFEANHLQQGWESYIGTPLNCVTTWLSWFYNNRFINHNYKEQIRPIMCCVIFFPLMLF